MLKSATEQQGYLISLVMRLSGGKIIRPEQANFILLGFALLMIIIIVISSLAATGTSPKAFIPEGYYAPLPGMPQKNP